MRNHPYKDEFLLPVISETGRYWPWYICWVFFIFRTFSDFTALHHSKGSWFIKSLCAVLESQHKCRDLFGMLNAVCFQVATEYETKSHYPKRNERRTMPWVASMLRKKVWLWPRIVISAVGTNVSMIRQRAWLYLLLFSICVLVQSICDNNPPAAIGWFQCFIAISGGFKR